MVEKNNEKVSECSVCNKEAAYKCSGCKNVAYCSKEHQKLHWKSHKNDCRPFEVKKSAELGRHLICNRDLTAGQLLLSEAPLIFGPKIIEPERICIGCYKPRPQSACPVCLWPACSPTCSGLSSQKHHVPECVLLRRNLEIAKLGNFNFEAITPLRCLLLQKVNPKKWLEFMSLESHFDDRKESSEIYQDFDTKVVKYLFSNILTKVEDDLFTSLSPELLHRICGILEVNALEMPAEPGCELLAIYPTVCLMEHDCIPNTRHIFLPQDFRIKLFSSVQIKSGEHISTMYTHALWGTKARQDHLKSSKYFLCKCSRCSDPTELNTNFSTLKCIGTEESNESVCGNFVLPLKPLEETTDWKCNRCPLILNSEQVADVNARISQQVENAMETPDIVKLEMLLQNLERLLHPNHYHCYTVKHSLIQLYGREKGFSHPELSQERLNRKIDLCKALLRITCILDPGNARLSLYSAVLLYELHSALLEFSNRMVDVAKKGELLSEAKEALIKCCAILADESHSTAGAQLLSLTKVALNKVTDLCNPPARSTEVD